MIFGVRNMKIYYIGIEYLNKNYFSVCANDAENKFKINIGSGNPVKDWNVVVSEIKKVVKPEDKVFLLSSCTHFVFDIEGYAFDKNDMLVKDNEKNM